MTKWHALPLSALTSPSRNKCFHHFLEVVILIPVAIPASKMELLLGGKKNLEWRSSVPHRDSLTVKLSVSGVPQFWVWSGCLLQTYFLLLSLLITLQPNGLLTVTQTYELDPHVRVSGPLYSLFPPHRMLFIWITPFHYSSLCIREDFLKLTI